MLAPGWEDSWGFTPLCAGLKELTRSILESPGTRKGYLP